MNEIEKIFIIFGILAIFISIPTIFICYCKKTTQSDYIEV